MLKIGFFRARSLTIVLLLLAAVGPAAATVPFDVSLSGPATFYPGQPLSGPFSGALTAAGVGVPNQTIEVLVDQQRVATSATALDGSFAFSLPPFTGTTDKTVRAVAFGGTPLETFKEIVVAVQRFSLTVATAGSGSGSVSSNPSGISCPPSCSSVYPATSQVTLSAVAAAGSVFTGWTGACSGSGTCTLTMTGDLSVVASFSPATALVTVTKSGTGSGTITSSPAGINCGMDCNESYLVGSVVTLFATPAMGSTFTGWSGGGCAGIQPCNITVTSGGATVNATFTLQTHMLTVAKAGAGSGVVTSTPAGINCGVDCTEAYQAGQTVALSAAPAAGSIFAGWSGGGCTGSGTCMITISAATTVTATFTQQMFTLTVSIVGDGSVTSNPAGITCPGVCSRSFPAGTFVQLSTLAQAGWVFAGWSGDCPGSCTLSSNRTAIAQFTTA